MTAPRGPTTVAAEMSALRACGLGVGVWTVNDVQEMRRFAALGVDSITSDRPELLREAFPPPAGR